MRESEGLEIRKGGKLFKTKWLYNQKEKKGRWVHKDVTDQAICMLFDDCSLDEGVTLRDIFLLLNTHLEMFDVVLGNWCKLYVAEGLKEPSKKETEIEYLDLYWHAETHKWDEPLPTIQGFEFPGFHGVGFLAKEDKLDKYGNLMCKAGDRITYAIEFTPANELAPLPVKLNPEFHLWDWETSMKKLKSKKQYEPQKFQARFTLGHILHGIIWELSWGGPPQKRDDFVKELDRRVEDIESGKVKTVPWDEVKKKLKKPKKQV